MLSAGHAGVIAEVTSAIPPPSRSRRQQLLLGDALRTSGSVINAAHAYAVIADREPTWDSGVAWRAGLIHYLRGDSHAALKAFDRAEEGEEATADRALLLSWRACAHLQLGETSTALDTATLACRTATAAGDDIALATAYVSLALCHSIAGETTDSDELYAQALSIAENRGHVVLRARILTSQTYQLLNEARYAEALEAARQTTRCAITAGHTNLQSIALCNEGDALLMLGRYDEATRQYERAQALCRRMGSRRSAAAHLGLGEIYRRRGWSEQARVAYEAACVRRQNGHSKSVKKRTVT
jgi:tetratricopeptide (TPR) repeat protein